MNQNQFYTSKQPWWFIFVWALWCLYRETGVEPTAIALLVCIVFYAKYFYRTPPCRIKACYNCVIERGGNWSYRDKQYRLNVLVTQFMTFNRRLRQRRFVMEIYRTRWDREILLDSWKIYGLIVLIINYYYNMQKYL